MSGHNTIILLIAALIITVGGVFVLYEVTQNMQQIPNKINEQQENEGGLVLTNVIGTNISSNDTYKYMRIQVRYDGEGQLNLNDTFIQLRTPTSTADLWYRNGTAERDNVSGFYTE